MSARATLAILRKDLMVELRTRQSVPAMALFSVTVYVLFHFGLHRNSVDGAMASGVLWVTLLLATVLGVNRLFAAEREGRALDGILLAPIDRWIATYERMSQARSPVRRCWMAMSPPATKPHSATIAIGTCT